MNIFIMILVALFMGAYYLMDTPSQRIEKYDTQYAIERSDLRAVAQCAAALHNAQINGTEFQDVCIEQNGIRSEFICLNASLRPTGCDGDGRRKPAYSYIVTATAPIDAENHNAMMEILEEHYADAGTFGLFNENKIISGGTATKPVVPSALVSQMQLSDNQLVYLTHFERPRLVTSNTDFVTEDIWCPVGTTKTYRFGRWQCVPYNAKSDCTGDTIWDSETYQCVPDNSRKPLCGGNQNAILIDDVWECISPFADKTCPNNMTARLNYNTLEWECVIDPTAAKNDAKKCQYVIQGSTYTSVGSTLRIPQSTCTECERMITDPDTCVAICVPDPAKLDSPECYAGELSECSGVNRALYFGFPNSDYINAIKDFDGIEIPLNSTYSQNRRFNCMDCGMGIVDTEKSVSPYVAICK